MLGALWTLTLAALALVGLLALWLRGVKAVLETPSEEDEIYLPRTADGWRVALARYRPRGTPRGGPPVLLCHGLWVSRRHFDLDARYSLARYLSRRGHDVFVADLRGSGYTYPLVAGAPRRYDVYTHLEQDVPALLDKIVEVTGQPQVHWVGHSMGAILGLGAALGPRRGALASVVAIGAPVTFRAHGLALRALLQGMSPVTRFVWPRRSLLRLVAPFVGWLPPPFAGVPINMANVEGPVMRRAVYNIMSELSYDDAARFSQWVREGEVRLLGEGTLLDGLGGLELPTLFLAGERDRLAPPAAVEAGFEACGAERRRLVVVGKSAGHRGDYGHGDLLIGRDAPEEVFPKVAEWIEGR